MDDARRWRRLDVLVLAHDLSITGGVNNFLRVMRRRLRPTARVTRFVNGRRKGEEGRLRTAWRMARDYLRFVPRILGRRFDVLHVNPTLDLSSMPREMMFVWLARLLRPRIGIIIFYRGWRWETLARLRRSRLGRAAFLATQRRADRILVLADSFRDALVELGIDPAKVRVLSTMFEGEVLGRVLQDGIEKQPGSMLFLSRFLPAKGGVSVLHSTHLLRERFPHIRLVMAGDGPQRAELEALADELGLRDIVTFTGYVGGEDKMRLLAGAELFLLPTQHPEGMPNAILEAMAAGQVIITTPIGGIPAVVEHGTNGTLLDRADPDTLTAAIAEYLADPVRTRAMGERNRVTAWQNWESAVVSQRIADEYAAVCQRPNRNGAATPLAAKAESVLY